MVRMPPDPKALWQETHEYEEGTGSSSGSALHLYKILVARPIGASNTQTHRTGERKARDRRSYVGLMVAFLCTD